MKYLRINLTKEVQDLYSEKYKMLLKDIKEDLNKLKKIPYSHVEILDKNLMIFPKLIYRFKIIFIKIPTDLDAETDKLII